MIRIVEARKAAVLVATDQEVVLEFVDADLKAIVGPQGCVSKQNEHTTSCVFTCAAADLGRAG